jgi:type II secretory pathway pseudopilin PulG
MRTGSLSRGRSRNRGVQRGFTYLILLFVLAAASATVLALSESAATAAQRERETELLFRGHAIRDALLAYRQASPAGRVEWPADLSSLLADGRGAQPRHHLRRLYVDPFTARADWRLLRDASGGIVGVASNGQAVALRQAGLGEGVRVAAPADAAVRVGDWLFEAGSSRGRSTP